MALPAGKHYMESSSHKIRNSLILFIFLLIMAGAFIVQQKSYTARLYAGKETENLNIVFLGEPALIMTYNPKSKTVNVSNAVLPAPKKTKKPPPELTPREKALKLLEVKKITPSHVKYFLPETDTAAFWADFKTALSSWRNNPPDSLKYIYYYAKAFKNKRTDITPYEFALLVLGTLNIEMTDFSVSLDAPTPKNAVPAAAAADGPLRVEIYNASGRKGAALALEQYLRDLNAKGVLSVDVFDQDNYSKQEAHTKIIDHTGRAKELKKLSLALRLQDNELFSEKKPNAFCDAEIIIGKDFEMPR